MRFVVAMAVREMRASWRRLLFFFICLSIGVGAIVAHPLGDPERARRCSPAKRAR